MSESWNGLCVVTDCDAVNHVEATGDSWAQVEGTAYNPATGVYDLPDIETVNGVWTDYHRD